MDKGHQTFSVYKVTRASILDINDPTALIHKTELRGFYVMFIMITVAYIIISSLNRFFSVGYFVEDSFFWQMVEDGKFVALLWPGVFLYTWLAYLLQLLILKGLSHPIATILQHLTQSIMFMIATYLVFSRNWGFSQTLYIMLLTFTHFMKMHSFTVVNRNLRRNYLKDPKSSQYPQNLTIKNYFIFLVTPALVYQTSYPKRETFRTRYFIIKIFLLLSEIVCMYLLITEGIHQSVLLAGSLSFFEMYSRLIVPCLVCYNLGFLAIFEHICNLFAEISYFGDREFYQDWWNSDGYADFSRKWNRPVHLFLHQHVYLEVINELKWSPKTAKSITFLLSAMCHEFLSAILCKRVVPYLFVLMMLQLPLIFMTNVLKSKYFGLYLVWFGLIGGPPLILTLYARSAI